MIEIDREITQDFERATRTGVAGDQRARRLGRHHGRRRAQPPRSRPARRRHRSRRAGARSCFRRLDETLHVEGESFELSCNQFPGTVAPRGFEHLTAFRKDLFPAFDFEAGGVRLRKTVAAVDGENTTLVLYEVLEAPGPFILSLRPFLAARDLHP